MPAGLDEPLLAYLDALSAADRAPAGTSAAGVAIAMGLGLFMKALAHPPAAVNATAAAGDRELLATLRKRVLKAIEAGGRAEATLPAADAEAAPTAAPALRLAAYRAARTLVDLACQGLGQIKAVLDMGGTGLIPDVEAAWRLQAAGLEAAIALCEDHLRVLPADLVAGEAEALATQATYGRELQARAMAELAWRRGKA